MIKEIHSVTTQSEASYLQQEISKSIQTLKKKVSLHKRKTSVINAFSISLGALVTLTLGMDVAEEYVQSQKNLALSLGALLTIVNGWNALFDYKKLWIRQKSTLLDLYQMQNELGYRKSKKEDCIVDDLFEQYQRIWEKDSNEWRSIIQTSSKSSHNKDKNKSNKKKAGDLD